MSDTTYTHPQGCTICFGTLIQLMTQRETDGYTLGVRSCPNLKESAAKEITLQNGDKVSISKKKKGLGEVKPPATENGDCGQKYLLPGLDQKQYNDGGLPCMMKNNHPGKCRVLVDQPSMTTIMEIGEDEDGNQKPKIVKQEFKR